jgi:hypothetical protein
VAGALGAGSGAGLIAAPAPDAPLLVDDMDQPLGALAFLLSSAPGTSAHAQTEALAVGKTVRFFLQVESGPVEGSLSSLTPAGWTLLLADGVVSMVAIEDSCTPSEFGFCEDLAGPVLLSFPPIGAGFGGLVGALFKSEEWVPTVVPELSRRAASFAVTWSVPVGG